MSGFGIRPHFSQALDFAVEDAQARILPDMGRTVEIH